MSLQYRIEGVAENGYTQQDRPVRSALSGCMYAAFVVAISAGMLLINSLLCLAIYSAIPQDSNEDVIARLGQLFFFIAPLALLIIEWNLLDRLQRLFRLRP